MHLFSYIFLFRRTKSCISANSNTFTAKNRVNAPNCQNNIVASDSKQLNTSNSSNSFLLDKDDLEILENIDLDAIVCLYVNKR